MAKIVYADFQKQLNQKFIVTFSEQDEYEVELVEVDAGTIIEALNIVPFSMLFRADRNQSIYNQGIYKLKDEGDKSYELFMIPRQPDNDSIYYEVIIN